MKGADAEDLALAHLQSAGLSLLERNVKMPGGELDLVMQDSEHLVIVEVRKRSDNRFGSALESVDARKQSRVIQATQMLLSKRPQLSQLPIRFDVVALDGSNRIHWVKAAFDAC